MEDIIILQYKNKYEYVIQQLKIDYTNKTYKIGILGIGADRTVTKKYFHEKVQELDLLNFKKE